MKDMAMFFKKVDVPSGMEPGAEIKKVLDFREQCIAEKKVFFRDFDDLENFRNAVRAKLMEIGWLEFKNAKSSAVKTRQEDQPPPVESSSEITAPSSFRLIDAEAQELVSNLLHRSADIDATDPSEIARFRLISISISRSGNDDTHLGTHDANLVFRHYRHGNLSNQETISLIDCGIAGFSFQNVPLWRWIAKADMGTNYLFRLRILATLGTNDEKIGAIKVLQALDAPLPTHDGYFNKTGVLTDWLSNGTDTRVFDAAVSFIGTNASENDITLIEQASVDLPPYKKSKVETAIVELLSRRSIEAALKHICKKSVSNIDDPLASKLFAMPQLLTTDTLELCLSAKPDAIRIGAAKILFARGEIAEERANDLLTDDNVEMRFVASEVLNHLGKALENEILEKVLRVQKTGGFGMFGYSLNGSDKVQLELYRANRRAEMDATKLVEMAEADFLQYKCLATLFEHYPAKARPRIKKELENSFSDYFDRSSEKFRNKVASDKDATKLADSLVPSYKKELCNSAVRALCKSGRSEDLELIRQSIDTLELDADREIFRFLSQFGDWQDVNRILKLGRDEHESGNALAFSTVSLPDERALALLSVGNDRIADLLSLDIDTSIRTSVLKKISKATFGSFTDDLILRELAHANLECRAIVALRCVQALSKARVTVLLDRYTDNADYRYYNSIHWLDLGVSLPSKLSKMVAVKELARR